MDSKHRGKSFERGLKRTIDVAVAVVGLVFLSPILLVIAIAVKLNSKGPVFYHHKRIGKNGKPFYLLKFRSMAQGKDDNTYIQYLKELIESERPSNGIYPDNGNGHHPQGAINQDTKPLPYRKMDGDPRITRVGRFLRKYYLDELPQLWNILKGEMSLVGPRPHVQMEVNYYTDEQYRRLSVSPGATGLWQVAGKADCTFNELIELDLGYIDRWNLWLDLAIIGRTFLLMARGGEDFWARMTKKVPNQRENGGKTSKISKKDTHPTEPVVLESDRSE